MQTNIAAHHDHDHHHDTNGNKLFGFWVYLMSDCVLFATLFATYAVLSSNSIAGPTGKDIFELPFVFVETMLLLFSSITFGFGIIAMKRNNVAGLKRWMLVTFALGLGFICMEVYEFHHLIVNGNGPQESAFLTAFFSLVGLHGAHVTAGLIWMTIMIIEVARRGLGSHTVTRLSCLSLFWHFLDIVWICVFTVVYLIGAM